MAEDYSISAKITADTSGFEKGIDKAQKASKNLSKSVSGVIQGLGKNGLVGALGAVGLASSGLSATLGSVVKIAKQVSKTIGECTEAYKTQLIAERALNTAIQNNPFVTGASSKALKEFASEMQKVSNYGDEELIPMMSNLISLGRTEAETMQIMSVAMDMSAGMGISLDTAITQLNATLNGNIGRLGQQNAELKDLTEEELRQGKAVEILGEKFKGLSSATADTSKQLKNIKGDFKEALGQFTLPSSDMWNKFWAGFYERGIEIINKINAYLDAQTIGKHLAENFKTYFNSLTGDIGDKLDYIEDYLAILPESELKALNNYLSGLRKIDDVQKTILKESDREIKHRELTAQIEKQEAEAKAEKVKQQEKENAELEKQKEKEKELADIRAKELKLENEWEDKLFAIRLENLEATRDKELENEKLTQEEREAIVNFYGEQILAMKIKQLEKERDEALKQENLTEEAKRAINLYYENRITNAKKDEEEKRLKLKKKEIKEEKKEEKSKFETMLEYARQYAKQVASVFKNIVSNVKNIFSKAGNIFMKIIEFNPDEALDNLLKFEDAILTFFVETLPKLPAFFKSAMQSIIVLIDTVLNVLDFDAITEIVSEIFETIISAITKCVGSGGWKKLLDAFLKLQQMIENVIADNLPAIVDTIVAMLPDLEDTLSKSIVSASKTLGKIAKPLFKVIIAVIMTVLELLNDDDVIDAMVDAIGELVGGLFEAIIEMLPQFLSKTAPKIIKMVIRSLVKLPIEIANSIIKGLVSAFAKTNWGQVVKDIFTGFIDGIKDLFGIHSPSTLFEGFGVNMIEGLVNGLQGISNAVNTILEPLYHLIANIFGSIGSTVSNSLNSAFTGLNNILNASANIISTIINSLVTLIDKATQAVNALNPLSGGSSGSTITGSSAGDVALGIATGGISTLGHKLGWWANGSNNVPKGLSIVGEAGPELVNFRGGEQVLNNRNTNKALAEMGKGTNNFNVTFNNMQDTTAFAMIQQLKNYNRQMAINGIM